MPGKTARSGHPTKPGKGCITQGLPYNIAFWFLKSGGPARLHGTLMSPIAIAGYLTLFAGTAILFVVVALALGRLVRPSDPTAAKLEPYECGEPAVGSSYVQFDLRFYVVALVFIIFEVEVAFFFPWAAVFGQVTILRAEPSAATLAAAAREFGLPAAPAELALAAPAGGPAAADALRGFALAALADLAVFFGVLLVGFAYLWRRGDLNWVRSVQPLPQPHEPAAPARLAAGAGRPTA